ncbi:MAG: tetratricopeptide repeat protein [Chloroflexia bacterium]|nr:tetratricopeptide repeat protein [Chloroflexia bacterium]
MTVSRSSPEGPSEDAPGSAGQRLQQSTHYLPAYLAARLEDPSTQETIRLHLSALLHTVRTYLPRRLRQSLRGRLVPGQVWGEWIEGTLLFADLSGFTRLSTTLSRLGLAGAEQLVAIVNQIFTAVLAIIEQEGGDLLVFGGDALLVLFAEGEHTRAAVRAALQMQRLMAGFAHVETGSGTFPLALHTGINSGQFLAASVGRPHAMHYVLLGHVVEEAAQAEALAGPGQTVLGASTARGLDLPGRWLEERWFRLNGGGELPPADPRPTYGESGQVDVLDALDTLVPYLPAGLLARLVPYPSEPTVEADLKPVAILFANLLGFESLLQQLGPDNLDRAVALLQRCIVLIQEIVERYGGTVNKIDLAAQGVKMLILFGAPYKHEDDPKRALSVALDMRRALEKLGPELAQAGLPELRQRLGLHTGQVFAGNVGSDWRKEYTVMGVPVNLAARLMAAAGPGRIWATEALYTQVGPGCRAEGPRSVQVKGHEAPLAVYDIQDLQVARRSTRRSPLLGRQAEMQRLRQALQEAFQGHGRVVGLVGEAGIGKSRLVEEFVDLAGQEGAAVLAGDTPSYGERIPYSPWDEVLRTVLGWGDDMDAEQRIERLEQRLTALSPNLTPWAPVMAEALGLGMEESLLTAGLDPRLRRQRFFDLALQLLQSEASDGPLCLVLEGLQWASPLAGELLTYLGRNLARSRVLILVTYRPAQMAQPWTDLSNHQQISLPPLSAPASQELLNTLTGCEKPDRRLSKLVWERAQGNPLYIEEIVQTLKEQKVLGQDNGSLCLQGDLEQAWQSIPATIQEVVLSRVDRLEEGLRSMLRVASVIDQEFPFSALLAVLARPDPEPVLRERIEQLCQAGMLESSGSAQYAFRHTLTREVAYQSILHTRRRELHERVARYYEQHFERQLEQYYGFLAHHYRHSDHTPKALEYALKAGRQAAHSYANETADLYFQQAREMLDRQDELLPTWERVQVLREHGDVLWQAGHFDRALESYQGGLQEGRHALSNSEMSEFYRRCSQVYERRGNYEQSLEVLQQAHHVLLRQPQEQSGLEMARVLSSMSVVYWRMGAYEEAGRFGQESLVIAQKAPPDRERSNLLGRIYLQLGTIAATTAHYEEAQRNFERGLHFHQEANELQRIAVAHNNLGYLWLLQGKYQQAIESYLHCLEVAQHVGDPYVAAYAANNLGSAWYQLGDYDLAMQYCQESLSVRERIGDQTGIASSWDTIGLIQTARGAYDLALETHRRSLELKRSLGDSFGEANSLINLSQAHYGRGDFELALSRGQEALELLDVLGTQALLAEAHICTAEALLALESLEQAARHAESAWRIAGEIGERKDAAIAARILAQTRAAAGAAGAKQVAALFQESIDALSALACRLEWARASEAYGRFLQSLDRGDEAQTYLEQAQQLYKELNLR